MSAPAVLCLNRGSSSLKFSVFEGDRCRLRGAVEGLEAGPSRAWVQPSGEARQERGSLPAGASAAAFALAETAGFAPAAAVHRLVRAGGGDDSPQLIDEALLARLRDAVPLAPLHLPVALGAIAQLRQQAPALPQLACFDTAFHRTLPPAVRRLPLPDHLDQLGLQRRGFHGLSCEHVVAALGPALDPRTVVAHLGQGASLTAIRDGRSVDTTMGLTPAGGIPMGTRTGDLDPGLVVHLLRYHGLSLEALDRLVEREGGLLAVGGSSDMRQLLERRATDPRAALAVDLFTLGVRKAIGALAASLGGLDLLVFTGGIGERAAAVRAEICAPLGFLGLSLETGRNERHADVLSPADGRVRVRLVTADEDRVMARHVQAWLAR